MTDSSICTAMTLLLSGYLDHELRGAERRQVEEHLAHCPHCQTRLEQLQRLDHTLRRMRATGNPAILAPRVMAQIEGTICRAQREQRGMVPGRYRLQRVLAVPAAVWMVRLGGSVLVLVVLAVLGLLAMARLQQLPQAPVPEASLNAVVFGQSEISFYLNATSRQGIRDLTLTYWRDPANTVEQRLHYDAPHMEIELTHTISRSAILDVSLNAAPAQALFYRWTIVEKSGRATDLPVQYAVYTRPDSPVPWHAITTTHTVLYFTDTPYGSASEMMRSEIGTLVEQTLNQVSSNLGLPITDQLALYLVTDSRLERMNAAALAEHPPRLELYLASGYPSMRWAVHAQLASQLTLLLLEQAHLSPQNGPSDVTAALLAALPQVMSSQDPYGYYRAAVSDAALRKQLPTLDQLWGNPAPHSYLSAAQTVLFSRYLIETYGLEKLRVLLAELKRDDREQAWQAAYGMSLQTLYTEWCNTLTSQVEASARQRRAGAPATNLFGSGVQTLWTITMTENYNVNFFAAPAFWLPDGRQLVYASPDLGYRSSMTQYTLFDGTRSQPLTITQPVGPLRSAAIAPDGAALLGLGSNSGTGSSVNTLTAYVFDRHRLVTLTQQDQIGPFVWSRSGSIVFSAQHTGEFYRIYAIPHDQVTSILTLGTPLTTTQPLRLIPDEVIPGNQMVLAVSRDGSTLAVMGQLGLQTSLYVVDLVHLNQARKVLELDERMVDTVLLSPDGSQLSFLRADTPFSTSLYVITVATGAITRLGLAPQPDQYVSQPTWVNNDWLIVPVRTDGGSDLYAARVGTPTLLRLTRGTNSFIFPSVAPDAVHLIFYRTEDRTQRLVWVTLDPSLFAQPGSAH